MREVAAQSPGFLAGVLESLSRARAFLLEDTMTDCVVDRVWNAQTVTLDDAGVISITDTDYSVHSFPISEIQDLYFRPIEQTPDRLRLIIWKKPDRLGATPAEVYAGDFEKNGQPRERMKKLVRDLGIAR
jgi:hypothetical protein